MAPVFRMSQISSGPTPTNAAMTVSGSDACAHARSKRALRLVGIRFKRSLRVSSRARRCCIRRSFESAPAFTATRLAPVDAADARALFGELRGAALLGPFRGRPAVDVAAVCELIARVSQLLVELTEVRELDLNPVLVGAVGAGCIAVDGLAVV